LTVGQVNQLQAEYKNKADFITIYLCEAHAVNQWPLGRFVVVEQHKAIKDRKEVATAFVEKTGYKIKMYVDSMENTFMNTFWAHPERFFIIDDGKLMLKAQPTDDGYYIFEDINSYLDSKTKCD